jgi:hypothetical protein
MFYIFHKTWIKFGTENVHINLLSKSEFRENIHSDSYALFKGLNEFLSVLSTFLSNLGEIWSEHMLSNMCLLPSFLIMTLWLFSNAVTGNGYVDVE